MFILRTTRCKFPLLSSNREKLQENGLTTFKSWFITPLELLIKGLLASLCFANFQLSAEGNTLNENQVSQLEIHQSEATKAVNPKFWAFVYPYNARYAVSSNGDVIGYSNRELSKSEEVWKLSTDATASKYFLKMTSTELSRFSFINNQLKTLEFDSKTKISFKKERHMNQVFNWQTKTEIGRKDKKSWKISHDDLVYDRVSHLIQLRADLIANHTALTYKVSYKGKLHDYHYEKQGEEVVTTKMGKLDTIKLTREKSNGDIFVVWMSPELNYFPVKISQLEEDKPDITMILESLEYITSSGSNQLPQDPQSF